ncbi:MAG: hypothetical protein HY332_11250 [Chloroflexi bacterium]|nr:hypothetical protein [Chloroflexota bacterium]
MRDTLADRVLGEIAIPVLLLLVSMLGAYSVLARIPQPYGRVIRPALALVFVAGAASWVTQATLGPLPGLAGSVSSWLVTGAAWALGALLAAGLLTALWVSSTIRARQYREMAPYGPRGRAAVLGVLLAIGFLGVLFALWALTRSYG